MVSEEDGIVLLDMIVCHACRERAKELGLRTEANEPPQRRARGWAALAHSPSP